MINWLRVMHNAIQGLRTDSLGLVSAPPLAKQIRRSAATPAVDYYWGSKR